MDESLSKLAWRYSLTSGFDTEVESVIRSADGIKNGDLNAVLKITKIRKPAELDYIQPEQENSMIFCKQCERRKAI